MKKFAITAICLVINLSIIFLLVSVVYATDLENPLGSIVNPQQVIGNVIKAMLGIVGSLALAVFIFGGFTWVTSAGNDEKIKKGKDMVMWASLGLAVVFLSYALVNFVIGAIVGGGQVEPTGQVQRTP